MEWDSNRAWRKQVERRVHEALTLAKGMGPAHADRISDLAEQIDDLRNELKKVSEAVEGARRAFLELKNGKDST